LWPLTIALAAVLLVVSSCGSNIRIRPVARVTTTSTTLKPRPTVHLSVCKTVHYGGFKVRVTSVAFVPTPPAATSYGTTTTEVAEQGVTACPVEKVTPGTAASDGSTSSESSTSSATSVDETTTSSKKSGGSSTTKDSAKLGDGSLTAFVDLVNTNKESAQFTPTAVSISVGGVDIDGEVSAKSIPGGGKNKGTLTFSDIKAFSFADAVLAIGSADEDQTKIPLGSIGKVVDFAPTSTVVSLAKSWVFTNSNGGVSDHKIDVKIDTVTTDASVGGKQSAKGTRVMTITGSAIENNDAQTTGKYFYQVNFDDTATLKLPDGSSVDAKLRQVGGGVPQMKPHFATQFQVEGEVSDPPSGSYELTLSASYGDAKLPVTFVLP